jgi:bacteriocin-like protein
MIAKRANVVALRTTWIEGFHVSRVTAIESPPFRGLPKHGTGARRFLRHPEGGGSVKEKKLTLSKETLRTLDEKELSQIVGGDQSGSNTPPQGGPNSCPNTKPHGCS